MSILRALHPAVWSLVASVASVAGQARSVDAPAADASAVMVDAPMAIGFFPPMTRQEWDADKDGRLAQEMSDIEIALGDVKACTGLEGMRTELITAHALRLQSGSKSRLLLLGDAVRPAMGVILAAPGRDPVAVFADLSATELQDTAPEAAAAFFAAPQCRRPSR